MCGRLYVAFYVYIYNRGKHFIFSQFFFISLYMAGSLMKPEAHHFDRKTSQ